MHTWHTKSYDWLNDWMGGIVALLAWLANWMVR